jgi:hypothetical protein
MQAESVPVSTRRQVDAAADLHEAILLTSDNPRLIELGTNMHVLTFSLQLRHSQLAADHSLSGHSLDEHRDVVDAILTGDPQHAEEVMRGHIRNGKQRLMALPDNVFHSADLDVGAQTPVRTKSTSVLNWSGPLANSDQILDPSPAIKLIVTAKTTAPSR